MLLYHIESGGERNTNWEARIVDGAEGQLGERIRRHSSGFETDLGTIIRIAIFIFYI